MLNITHSYNNALWLIPYSNREEISDVAQQPVKLPTLFPIRTYNANHSKAYNFNTTNFWTSILLAGNDFNRITACDNAAKDITTS